MVNKTQFPKADEGLVYPKMSTLINKQEFRFDISKEIKMKELQNLIPEFKFLQIAECVFNTPNNFPKSKRVFMEGRNFDKKMIDYIPSEDYVDDWKLGETQWVYCIVYGDHVVKIGMTASGMAQRFGSYNTGTTDAMKKGSCATTNFVLSQCNYLALTKGMQVRIFAYKIPTESIAIRIFGTNQYVLPKVAYKYEEVLIKKVIDIKGTQPILCGFSDNEK